MKNSNQERLGRLMKQYHRNNKWPWGGGFYFPYTYPQNKILSLSDEVGFVLNDRRVIVCWVHPRMTYSTAISRMAWEAAGSPPIRAKDMFASGEKKWKKLGRSRKKVSSFVSDPISASQEEYYAKLDVIISRMMAEGIDLVVHPTITVKRWAWCIIVELCAPMNVRNKEEARAMAILARRLIAGETTFENEFPGYEYGRAEWLAEAELRNQDKQCTDLD